jgi:hypothetical protein
MSLMSFQSLISFRSFRSFIRVRPKRAQWAKQGTAPALRAGSSKIWFTSLCLLASVGGLAGCDWFTDYPKPSQKVFFEGRFCVLAEVGPMQHLPNSERGLQRIAYDVAVDCKPKGGQLMRRIEGTQVFQHNGPPNIMSGPPWNAEPMTLRNTPSPASADAGASVTPPAVNRYADGPECNAMTQRMAEQVLPCLQSTSPEAASDIQAHIRKQVHGRLSEKTTPNLAAALMVEDEQCLSRWRQINLLLMGLPTGAACAIPP